MLNLDKIIISCCILCGMLAVYYMSLYVLVSVIVAVLIYVYYESQANGSRIHVRGLTRLNPLRKLLINLRLQADSALISVMKSYRQFKPVSNRTNTNGTYVCHERSNSNSMDTSQRGYINKSNHYTSLDSDNIKCNERRRTLSPYSVTSSDSIFSGNKSLTRNERSHYLTPKRHSRASNDMSFSPKGSPWGTSVSPKLRSHGAGVKTVQTVAGPLLASTRYNININSGLYGDVNSPGFSSRVARYAAENSKSLTHQKQYMGPGQFPLVQLDRSASKLPVVPTRRASGIIHSPVMVRVAPPEASESRLLKKSQILSGSCEQDQDSTKSVLEVLKEISRKRIHSQLDDDSQDDIVKRQRKGEVQSSLEHKTEEKLETDSLIIGKRGREDSPGHDESNSRLLQQVSKRTRNNEILSSLSSSRNLLKHMKRKSSAADWSRSTTPVLGKQLKQSRDILQEATSLLMKTNTITTTSTTTAVTTNNIIKDDKPDEMPEVIKPSEFLPRFAAVLDKNSAPVLNSVEALEAKRAYDSRTRLRSMLAVIAGDDDFMKKPDMQKDVTSATSTTTSFALPTLTSVPAIPITSTTPSLAAFAQSKSSDSASVSSSSGGFNSLDAITMVEACKPITSESTKTLFSFGTTPSSASVTSAASGATIVANGTSPVTTTSGFTLGGSLSTPATTTTGFTLGSTPTAASVGGTSSLPATTPSGLSLGGNLSLPATTASGFTLGGSLSTPATTNSDFTLRGSLSLPASTASSVTLGSMPATTASGFTLGSMSTTTASGFTLGSMPTTTASGFTLGSMPATTASGFTLESMPATTASGFTLGNLPTTTASGFMLGNLPTTTASGFMFSGGLSSPTSSSAASIPSTKPVSLFTAAKSSNEKERTSISTGLFGSAKNNEKEAVGIVSPLFGASKDAAATSTSLVTVFGTSDNKGTNFSTPLFGAPKNNVNGVSSAGTTSNVTTTSVGIFSTPKTSEKETNNTPSASGVGLFGASSLAAPATGGVFGTPKSNTKETVSIFGTSKGNEKETANATPVGIFATNKNSNEATTTASSTVAIFGTNKNSSTGLFGKETALPSGTFSFGTKTSPGAANPFQLTTPANQPGGFKFELGSTKNGKESVVQPATSQAATSVSIPAATSQSSAPFQFSSSKPAFSFGSTATTNGPMQNAGGFAFGGAQQGLFSFGSSTSTTTTQSSKPGPFSFATTKPSGFPFSGGGMLSTQPTQSSTTTQPLFGGSSPKQGEAQTNGGMFGNSGSSTSSPFGSSSTTPAAGLFGSGGTVPAQSFNQTTNTFGGGVFGTPATQASGTFVNMSTPTFGSAAASSTQNSESMFGSPSQPFGSAPQPSNTFGSGQPPTSLFGSSGATPTTFGFGSSSSAPAPSTGTSLFGSGTTPFQFGTGSSGSTGGFNFETSGVSTSAPAVNFGAGTSTPPAFQFGAGGSSTPLFSGQSTGPSMFSIGSGSTAPRARTSRMRRQR